MMITHFIFGYGSLISRDSRAMTAPETLKSTEIAVQISGIEPVFAKKSRIGMTAMGIRRQEGASAVGIIIPVAEKHLPKFDRREQGYSRIQINLDDVDLVPFLDYDESHKIFVDAKNNNDHESVRIWAYLPQRIDPPTSDHPIVQSYVDTILRGCIDVGGERFAREFIQSTKGWNPEDLLEDSSEEETFERKSCSDSMYSSTESVWVDDRHDPIYIRGDPSHSKKNASRFDRLLRTCTPDTFEERIPLETTE